MVACLPRALGLRSSSAGASAAVDPLAAMTADPSEEVEWQAGRERSGAQGASGASINAKVLQRTAPYNMSLLMHAMYGLDQYPQYMLKWPSSHVDEAVSLLEARLQQAREAQAALRARETYVAQYEPLHPKLRLPKAVDVFTPRVCSAIERLASKVPPSLSALRSLFDLVEEMPGVYSFNLLSRECCEQLREELAHYARYREAWMAAHEGQVPPGTLRERLQLLDAGLAEFERFLFEAVAKPLSKILFGSFGTREDVVGEVDTSHTFAVGYGEHENIQHNITRKALVPHVDDAEVTINVCLSSSFTGGSLRFHGLRSPDKTTVAYELPEPNQFNYQHRLGRAVMHLGNHFHEVLDVTSGERHVLIMWLRSWKKYRASHCPCCLKFRREYCVCSPEWN